jgi:hypothetical protein
VIVSAPEVRPGLGPDDKRAVWTAAICAVLSAALVITGSVYMFEHSDQRLVVTTLEPFHDWGGLLEVFRGAEVVDPRFNPPSLDHARFVSTNSSLAFERDMYERGLLSEKAFANISARFNQTTGRLLGMFTMAEFEPLYKLAADFASQFAAVGLPLPPLPELPSFADQDPRLLFRLLAVSGCSFPDAPLGETPLTRSPGCQCIGDAYVAFVTASENMTTNVSRAVRDAGAEEAMRCLDRRVVWHTWGAGRDWTIHPLGLAVFADGVFLLLCAAFLLSFYHARYLPDSWQGGKRTLAIKALIAALAVAIGSVFVARDWRGNLFQLLGLGAVLWNLLLNAHEALDYVGREGYAALEPGDAPPEAHPLMICFWLNVPLLLSAAFGAIAVVGLMRDAYALCVVVIGAALMGLLLQASIFMCFFLFSCYYAWLTKVALAAGLLVPLVAGQGHRQLGGAAPAPGLHRHLRGVSRRVLGVLLGGRRGLPPLVLALPHRDPPVRRRPPLGTVHGVHRGPQPVRDGGPAPVLRRGGRAHPRLRGDHGLPRALHLRHHPGRARRRLAPSRP